MNFIIKVAQITVVFITMNGSESAARPTNDIDNSALNTGTSSCKIASVQNACHIFMLDPSLKLQTNTGKSDFKQIAVNLSPQNKPENFTFPVIGHHGGLSNTYGALKNKELVSASFGLSRVAHNESLKIVDGETSNEHAQVNLLIQFDAVPTIEKYVQFFASTDYFTIAK